MITFFYFHTLYLLYIGKEKEKYVTDIKIPDWLLIMADNLINLYANPADILRRRKQDILTQERERITKLAQIKKHQHFCDLKWQDIKKSYPKLKKIVVRNNDNELDQAVKTIINFIKE